MGFLKDFINKLDSDVEPNSKTITDIATEKASELMGKIKSDMKIQKKMIDNVFVFIGASGGVGCSTVVANVATELSNRHMKVLVIDANVLMPAVPYSFGIRNEVEEEDLVSLATGTKELRDCIKTNGNISFLYSTNRRLSDCIALESETASASISDIIYKAREVYDAILIDCPNRVESLICNTMMYSADTLYFVWDESVGSVVNTERIRQDMLVSGIDGTSKSRVIMNKRTNVKYTELPFKELNIERVTVLPFTTEVIECGMTEKIFIKSASSSSKAANDFAKGIEVIADDILVRGGYGL